MRKVTAAVFGLVAVAFSMAIGRTASTPNPPYQADSLLVEKDARTITVFTRAGQTVRYRISLGGSPVGTKHFEGDERTPEGIYTLDWRNEKSAAYRALHISYPNASDSAYALAAGRSPGGMIMIHGLPNGFGWIGRAHRLYDRWTNGCVAVTNAEMDELWAGVSHGTPIRIAP